MPGFVLHTSNRLELLLERLSQTMRDSPLPPLQEEYVLVQSRGMQRWVSMHLADRFGVCANIRFPFPNAFVEKVFARCDSAEASPHFTPSVLTWHILRILPRFVTTPPFADIAGYVGTDLCGLRAVQLAGQLADLFDQYTIFRPDWILAWRQGTAVPDLGPDEHWQRLLFGTIMRELDLPERAQRRQTLLDRLRTGEVSDGLPKRVSVFGISYLPEFHLQVLSALRQVCQVDIYALNPCAELWDYIATPREADRIASRTPDADRSDLHLEEGHELLASLGQHGRDFFRVLHALDPDDIDRAPYLPQPTSMLTRVQHDMLTLADTADSRIDVDDSDRTLVFASCHSRLREVESLGDYLRDCLEQGPNLNCRDILVMAPDIEAYVPFVNAVFDRSSLPYSVADRSLRTESAVSDFLELLDFRTSRFRASRIMRLLELPGVRARFDITQQDLDTWRDWVAYLRIRWGIDGDQRRSLGMPPHELHTWRAGIDRLLLRYAVGDTGELFGGILPYDGAPGDPDMLDRFLRALEALFESSRLLQSAARPDEWARRLQRMLDIMLLTPGDERGMTAVRGAIDAVCTAAADAGFEQEIAADVISALLEKKLSSLSGERGYLAGGITFCSMLPMRSIPFKVICLLGMSDGDFPRRELRSSFDLMSRHPRRGDRSMRLDDRYLFLEAIVSARQHLYISSVGQSSRDNTERPASACVLELRSCVARRFTLPEGRPLTTTHRLQPFSAAYFDNSRPELFSYSSQHRDAAQLLASAAPHPVPVFAPSPVQTTPVDALGVEDMVRFLRNPSRLFINTTLGITLEDRVQSEEDTEPFELLGLDRYMLGAYLAEEAPAGRSRDELCARASSRGLLPHDTLGTVQFGRIADEAERYAAVRSQLADTAATDDLDIAVDIDGVRLTGRTTVCGGTLLCARFGRLRAVDLLRAWVWHLCALCSTAGEQPVRTRLLWRTGDGTPEAGGFDGVDTPRDVLADLLDLYRNGLSVPCTFFPETSLAFCTSQRAGDPNERAYSAAHKAWDDDYGPNEHCDAYAGQIYGPTLPAGEPFERTARRVYNPLLDSLIEVPV